jgi:hypothetical protein
MLICTNLFISLQIISNIVKNPTEEKFQRVPADNKKFVETVSDRKGGKSFMVAAGFVKKVVDHREYWTVNKQGDQWMETLETALVLLDEKHNQFQRLAEDERLRDEKQKKLDAERAAIAMRQYEDVPFYFFSTLGYFFLALVHSLIVFSSSLRSLDFYNFSSKIMNSSSHFFVTN